MLTALAIVTASVVGTMVGVEFAVAVFVNPIFQRMPVGAALEARADGGRVLGRVMPFWYVGSLILTAGLAAATWDRSATAANPSPHPVRVRRGRRPAGLTAAKSMNGR